MSTLKKQIIAIGGGGFSKCYNFSSDNMFIEKYILEQTGKKCPSICFLPTASADSPKYITDFYSEFLKLNCKPSHLSLFKPCTADIEGYLLENDALYVGGGNTRNMLALFKDWGIDSILEKAWNKGIVLAGLSAGSMCWFAQGLTDSIPGGLTVIKGFGFLSGSNCPHYDTEHKRRPAYHSLIEQGKMLDGIALDENVAAHYINDRLEKVIATSSKKAAYRVYKEGNEVKEERIVPFVPKE